jgi:hypothetical protein
LTIANPNLHTIPPQRQPPLLDNATHDLSSSRQDRVWRPLEKLRDFSEDLAYWHRQAADSFSTHHDPSHHTILFDPICIVGIDDKDDCVCSSIIVIPKFADFFLSSNIPIGEDDILVFDSFHFETNLRGKENEAKCEDDGRGETDSLFELYELCPQYLICKGSLSAKKEMRKDVQTFPPASNPKRRILFSLFPESESRTRTKKLPIGGK